MLPIRARRERTSVHKLHVVCALGETGMRGSAARAFQTLTDPEKLLDYILRISFDSGIELRLLRVSVRKKWGGGQFARLLREQISRCAFRANTAEAFMPRYNELSVAIEFTIFQRRTACRNDSRSSLFLSARWRRSRGKSRRRTGRAREAEEE